MDDTIVAISSAAGMGARMIVRVSGPRAGELCSGLFSEAEKSETARRCEIRFSGIVCPAWVLQFKSPSSYTGEDVVELHVPGNVVLARMLFDWLVAQGARAADAGEFTARAYFNGKLDLTQAEGVAATIAAHNRQELGAARQLMAGELSRRLQPVMENLTQFIALVEAGIDFSDEGVEFLSKGQIADRLAEILRGLDELVAGSARLEALSREPMIVLAGRPNAGKSTLCNALAGQRRAVVSPVAGTTRDALSAMARLPRGTVRIVDVAGLEEGDDTREIQRKMREQALRAVEEADVLVLVRDAADSRANLKLPRAADLVVLTKGDLLPRLDAIEFSPSPGTPGEGWGEGSARKNPHPDALLFEPEPQSRRPEYRERGQDLLVSAVSGFNMNMLREELDRLAFGSANVSSGANLALGARHLQLIGEATAALRRAGGRAREAELLAADLREALDALGGVLGAVTPDDVLGKIFSSFCIGK